MSRCCHILLLLLSTIALSGCASYRFGSQAMFPPGIGTVHVPIVRNETFRHDLGVQLTEAIGEEIERRTPYKVVSSPYADSVLQCNIIGQNKIVLSETENDDPRALDTSLSVGATWKTRDGRSLMQNSFGLFDTDQTGFAQSVRFVPEAGQSIDTANQDAINQLARRIVSQMESRW